VSCASVACDCGVVGVVSWQVGQHKNGCTSGGCGGAAKGDGDRDDVGDDDSGEQCGGGGSKFQAVVFELVGTFPPSTVVLVNRTCVHVWYVRTSTGGTLGSTSARPLEQP
jgi:hypothetical protein